MELKTMTTRWWVPPKTHPDFEMMTGQHMLETLERIFRELDEMGVQADTVTCPHVYGPRGIGTLVYMGHTLDFCRDCHDRVAAELGRQVDNLRSDLNIPEGYRWPRPEEFGFQPGWAALCPIRKSPAPA